MARNKSQQSVPAMALFNGARQYADAANELFTIADARPKTYGRLPFADPLYLLYSHAAELALKAFLRAKNIPYSTRGHSFSDLYAKSRDSGALVVGSRDRFDIENVVSLFDSGNKNQGFRYFNLEPGARPELLWVREVITDLLRAVEPHVPEVAPDAVKATIVVGRPGPKTDVRPKARDA